MTFSHAGGQRPAGTERARADAWPAISGNSHAMIEGLFDNTGLNSDSTLTVNNAADCTFAGGDPRQHAGQRHGQGEPGEKRRRRPAAERHATCTPARRPSAAARWK